MKENMSNYCGNKIPLLMKGDVFTLCYYGIHTMQSVGQIWIPQCGLDRPQNVISIILPSGKEKLGMARPKHDCTAGSTPTKQHRSISLALL
jgi:hypothetical protein